MKVNAIQYVLTSIIMVVLGGSCGIETLNNYLNYTPRNFSSTSSGLIFYPPEIFEANFFGIEVYYKIYENDADANTDKGLFYTRQLAETVPGSLVSTYLQSSTGLGYKKICILDTNQIEPFSIARDSISSSSIISIDVLSNEIRLIIDANPNVLFYRNIPGQIKSFSSIPLDSDTDYKTAVKDTKRYVQLYAVAYGFDTAGSFSQIYSKAEYLGLLLLED